MPDSAVQLLLPPSGCSEEKINFIFLYHLIQRHIRPTNTEFWEILISNCFEHKGTEKNTHILIQHAKLFSDGKRAAYYEAVG